MISSSTSVSAPSTQPSSRHKASTPISSRTPSPTPSNQLTGTPENTIAALRDIIEKLLATHPQLGLSFSKDHLLEQYKQLCGGQQNETSDINTSMSNINLGTAPINQTTLGFNNQTSTFNMATLTSPNMSLGQLTNPALAGIGGTSAGLSGIGGLNPMVSYPYGLMNPNHLLQNPPPLGMMTYPGLNPSLGNPSLGNPSLGLPGLESIGLNSAVFSNLPGLNQTLAGIPTSLNNGLSSL